MRSCLLLVLLFSGLAGISQPVITSFTPTSAGTGATITVTGTGLSGVLSVTLGGTSVASFTAISSTTLIAVVGTGSSGDLSVTSAGGTGALSGFTYIPAPTITSFTPTSAAAGATITITGTNLSGVLTVTLGGTSVASFTAISSTTLTAIVGAGSSGDLSITSAGGSAAFSGFNYIPVPTITSFTPTSAGAGTTITITGTNLSGVLSVTLGGTSVASFTAISSTTLIAVVGTGSSGVVSVTSASGTGTLNGFTYVPVPTITSFTPTSAAAGATITITGTNLSGVLTVTLGGTAVASFNVLSSTTLTAIVGNGSSGTLTVTTAGGASALSGFTYIPAPTITSFTPTSAAGGATITITGTNLSGVLSVTLGGTSVASFGTLSSTTLTAIVGTGSSGTLAVTTAGGTAVLSGFNYTPVPTITSFTPTSAATGGAITITGTGLSGVLSITLGGTAVASFNVLSSTTLIAVVGSGTTGNLSITTSGGTVALSGFVYIPPSPPVIVSFNPASGAINSTVTINGSNFDPNPSNNIVYFGATKANVTSATNSVLQVSVPSGATYQPFSVLNKTSGLTAYAAKPFLVTFPGATQINTSSLGMYNQFNFGPSAGSAIAIGDVDGDGKPEMIVSNYKGTSKVTIYRNTNTGTGNLQVTSFTTPVGFLADGSSTVVAIGDLDGDGKPEIVTANLEGRMSVFWNTSTTGTINSATFAQRFDYSTGGTGGWGIAISDLDGDGKPEIVVTNRGSGNITVFKNNTTKGLINAASFATSFLLASNTTPQPIFISDIDHDGLPDIIIGNRNIDGISPGGISIFRNHYSGGILGSSSFDTRTDLLAGKDVWGIAVGDMDGDGKPDLLSANFNSNSISIFRNISSPGAISTSSFAANVDFATERPWTVVLGDMNGDGKPDVIVPGSTTLAIYQNTASPGAITLASLAAGVHFPTIDGFMESVAIADLDEDGKPDIAGFNTTFTGVDYPLSVYQNKVDLVIAPTITSFTPTSAGTGSAITLTGTNFNGTSSVSLGGTSVASFRVLSSTTLIAVVGTGSSGSISVTTAGGTAALSGFVFIPPLSPTVASFTPLSAATGATITITGTNLTGITSVSLGGTAVASFHALSSTTLTAVVGNGASGTLSVTTAGGTAALFGFVFIPPPPPTISSFTPLSAASGTAITVTGTNLTTVTSVTLAGTAVASFRVLSSTTLIAVVGTGSSGTITVTTAGGTASLTGFTYIPSLTITSFTPTSAYPESVITIFGTNFSNVTEVTINGLRAAYSIVSPTQMWATPVIGTQSGPIIVTTAGGGSASINGLIIDNGSAPIGGYPAPLITSVIPSSALTAVTINGSNFYGVMLVKKGNDTIPYNVISPTKITAFTGSNEIPDSIFLQTFWGVYGWKHVTSKPPVISSFMISAGTNEIDLIKGIHFTGVSSVKFGRTPAASFTVLNDSTISAIAGQGSSGFISVTNPDGTDSLAGFTFIPIPKINSLSTLAAPIGASITISGKNFSSTITGNLVYFGSAKAFIKKAYSDSLVVLVPIGASYDRISVITNGRTAYSTDYFNVLFRTKKALDLNSFIKQSVDSSLLFGAKYFFRYDLDGDGKPDLVTINSYDAGSKTINVFRNTGYQGNISFGNKTELTAGINPTSISFGDLDGDGKPDMVAANKGENTISVFRNISTPGNIAFATRKDYAIGSDNPIDGTTFYDNVVAITDLNNDGKPDLVAAAGNAGIFCVLRNISSTNSIDFAAMQNFGTPSTTDRVYGPVSLSVADLDKYGNTDLIFGNAGNGSVTVFTNTSQNGIFSFASARHYPIGPGTEYVIGRTSLRVAIGDLDGDGLLDIVASNADDQLQQVFALRNTGGNGINLTAKQLILDKKVYAIALDNFDSDGKPDLVAPSFGITNFNTLALHNNGTSGNINFDAPISYESLQVPTNIVTADFDGDGKPDILTFTSGKPISVLRSNSSLLIRSFSPDSARAGQAITIKGSHFTGVTAVNMGNISAASFSILSDSVITAVTGSGETGYLSLNTVQDTAMIGLFTYISSTPAITSFTPASAISGTTVTIKGTNFTDATKVRFGDVNARSFIIDSSTQIRAVVDTGSSGSIYVTTLGGTASLAGFTYTNPLGPTITSFTPASAISGTTVTIKGTNFTGVTKVRFGNVDARSFIIDSATQIRAVVDTGSSGSLSITTSFGTAVKAGFIYISGLSITADSDALCKNGSVTLRSSITSASSSQWYKDGVLIPGAIANIYAATATGSYTLTAIISGNTFSSTNHIDLTISPQPVAAFTVSTDTTQCLFNNSFKFTNTSTITGINAGIASRAWVFGDSTGSDLSAPSHTYKNPGTYHVKLIVTSNLGCTDTLDRIMKVLSGPLLLVTTPAVVCGVISATVDITAPAVIAGSDKGLLYNYWYDSSAITSLANAAVVTASGIYYIKGTDSAGCTDIKPVTVTINPLPVVAPVTGDATVCMDASILLQDATKGGIWTSSNKTIAAIDSVSGKLTGLLAGTTSIVYNYTNSITGCTNTVSKTITVNPSPISGKPLLLGYNSDTVTCFFTSVAISSKNVYDKYLWSTGETSSSITVSNNAAVSLKIGSNQSGCYSDSSVIVTARKNLTVQPVITRSGDNLVSSSANFYQWLFNNKFTGDSTRQELINGKGIYNVSTSTDNICWNTSPDYIVLLDVATVKKAFDLTAYPNPSNGIFSLQVKFDKNTSALVKVTIVDAIGVTKYNTKKLLFNDKSMKIPVNLNLVKGTYTISVEINGEVDTIQMIIL